MDKDESEPSSSDTWSDRLPGFAGSEKGIFYGPVVGPETLFPQGRMPEMRMPYVEDFAWEGLNRPDGLPGWVQTEGERARYAPESYMRGWRATAKDNPDVYKQSSERNLLRELLNRTR